MVDPATRGECKTDFQVDDAPIRRVRCYISRESFEMTDFSDFGLRNFDDLLQKGPVDGWKKDKFYTTEEFLQSWLFFGLISVFLRRSISAVDFVEVLEDGLPYVHTKKLPDMLRAWQPGKEDYTSISGNLEKANIFVSGWWNRLRPEWGIPPELWLSISILGETLTHAQLKVLTQNDGPSREKVREWWWGRSQYLEEAAAQRGWCHSTAKMLSTTYGGLSGLYIVTLLPPPEMPHSARQALINTGVTSQTFHSGCKEFVCTANLVKEDHFPLHRKSDCKCALLCPDAKEVAKILRNGNIPTTRAVDEWKDGRCVKTLKVREIHLTGRSNGTSSGVSPYGTEPFVALSHVWSDGLGNHMSNSLPLCRINQIQAYVNELCYDEEMDNEGRSDVFFWIDTLCVPWDHGELRSQAIKRMNAVYRLAHKVLVLDEDLRHFSRHNGLEPLIRINTSKWVRRLWTLQEGTVCDPKQLFFQFSEETALPVTKVDKIFDAAEKNRHLAWIECSRMFNTSLRSLRDLSKEEAATALDFGRLVDNLWQALQWRASQKGDDETICLATLLKLPLESLLEPPENDEQRMCTFLTLLDESWLGIPAGMIFLPGPKLVTAGFRWAVKTWMGSVPREYPYPLSLKHKLTHLTTRGLLLTCAGLRLPFKSVSLPALPFYVRVWRSNNNAESSGILSNYWVKIELVEGNYRFPQSQLPARRISDIDSGDILLMMSNELPKQRPELALLVYVTKEKLGVKWVQTIGRVWTSQITSYTELGDLERIAIEPKGANNDREVFEAQYIMESQSWCVEGELNLTELKENVTAPPPEPPVPPVSRSVVEPRSSKTTGVTRGTLIINQPAPLAGLRQDIARPLKRRKAV